MIETIFVLMFAFQAKHFLADFPLQNEYMLNKFKEDVREWVPALSAHVGIHGLFTMLIASITLVSFGFGSLSILGLSFGLAIFDMVIHFVMDRIKASPYMLGRYNPKQKAFWMALGTDQTVHHVTHYVIIGALVFLII